VEGPRAPRASSTRVVSFPVQDDLRRSAGFGFASRSDGARMARPPDDGPAAGQYLPAALTELASLMLATPTVTELLEDVAGLAAEVVTPRGSCGITLRTEGSPLTVVNSDARAAHLDEVQYGQDGGPCLESMRTGQAVLVADVTAEHRWASYPGHALGYGVGSSLSLPLAVNGEVRGALNLYSGTKHAFGAEQRHRAEVFAIQAATVLTVALRQARQAQLTEQLREALATRSGIDQALGILMAQQRCDRETAFSILRNASQHQNRKLRHVAADIVEAVSGQRPQTPFNDPS
jgi:GAF domain-containing protein